MSHLDTPWNPDSLAIAPVSAGQAHIALSIACWLGDPWCWNSQTGEIVGPSRQRLRVRLDLDDSAGDWLAHVIGDGIPGDGAEKSFAISVPATLAPSSMAQQVRLRLLPDFELALARAFETPQAVQAAERRRVAAQAALVAHALGEDWQSNQDLSGIATASCFGPGRVGGSFTFTKTVCDLSLTVDWELAQRIAITAADYVAASGPSAADVDNDVWDPVELPEDPSSAVLGDVAAGIAARVAVCLGPGWSAHIDPGMRPVLAGPYARRIGMTLSNRDGNWLLLLNGRFPAGHRPNATHQIAVAATLAPPQIATEIRQRLLPGYEPALASALQHATDAAEARAAAAAMAADLASILGPAWSLTEPGTAPEASPPVVRRWADPAAPKRTASGAFAASGKECTISITVDHDLARRIAHLINNSTQQNGTTDHDQ